MALLYVMLRTVHIPISADCRSCIIQMMVLIAGKMKGSLYLKTAGAFNNGRGDGDGCGFKFGRTSEQPLDVPQRIITHAWLLKTGLLDLIRTVPMFKMVLFNNIAYDNDDTGFELSQYQNEIIVKNNINYKNGIRSVFQDQLFMTIQLDASPSISVSDIDLISTDSVGVSGPRQSDGSLPVIHFLNLNSEVI